MELRRSGESTTAGAGILPQSGGRGNPLEKRALPRHPPAASPRRARFAAYSPAIPHCGGNQAVVFGGRD
jgi:hypothetical protein